ncbi:MAG: hypothetical protein QG603_416 [Patescibacteria group bacterium]|nr:hypothetical protein [Patescibacteria group bacterium]MDQ5970639.1 hypothetical protein [Patescibacteria group bacterium]
MKKSKQNKKKEQTFAWSFVIVCFLLSGAVLLNMVSTNGKKVVQKNDKVISEGQNKEKSVVIQDNKYQYDSIELSYVLENQKNIVYISKNGVKKVLLDNVIYDAPGGSEPKFYKTNKPNIALLESGLGDMGSIIKEYYYIDLLSERILIVINNNISMSVNGVKLFFDISDDCGTGADRVAGRAYLSNLLVDGGVKHTFDPKIELTCVNPDGFGSIYESEPTFNFKSADVEQGKVYFSVLQNSFSFNISDKSITSADSWSLYTNKRYGFEFKYPNNSLLEEGTEDNSGTITYLKVFDREAKNLEGKNIPGYFTYMTVSYWDDLNNEYAKGGSWMGQRHYGSLEDMFTDDKAFIQKESEIELAGIKAYEVIVGGYSATYGIMFEYNNGVYRIDFPDEIQHKPNVSVREEIISTFKFLDK